MTKKEHQKKLLKNYIIVMIMKMKGKITSLFFTLIITINVNGQKPKLFIGATAHIGDGEVIENSAISISNGKFDLVGDATKIRIDPNAFDTIYKLYGKHIYPSFILPNTTLGITEIDAVRASRDFRETGEINPNIRSLIAYNTDYLAALEYLSYYKNADYMDWREFYILGNGGYALAVKAAAKELNMEFTNITRDNWDWNTINNIKECIVYNCTPLEQLSHLSKDNIFIDCIVTTKTGLELATAQAAHQFKLYTGLKFPY